MFKLDLEKAEETEIDGFLEFPFFLYDSTNVRTFL